MSQRSNFRSRARQRAMQALYQWQITADNAADVRAQFGAQKRDRKEAAYFDTLFSGVADQSGALDDLAAEYLDRPVAQIDPIERSILWISLFEFQARVEVPYRVIINEGVELAKRYGADASHKYINAVLDRAARKLRVSEWTNSG